MAKELTARPLTLRQYSDEKQLPIDYLVKVWGLREVTRDGITCVEQPYTRFDGTVCAPRYRYANAKLSPKGCGDRIVLYGQKQLINKAPEQVVLVEGESDTQTLRYAGLNVLGIPGTSMWDKCMANDPDMLCFLAGKTVVVIQEPPSASERSKNIDSPNKMIARIRDSQPLATVVAVRLWELAPRDEDGEPLYKDVSGLWTYYGGWSGFVRFMEALHIASRAAAKRSSQANREIQSVLASDVEMELTKWLWYDHIPVGDVTVFAGMPGKGKSTAAVDVVARLTTGKDFPGSQKQVDACEVAILASEDNHRTTTVPRLRAADADVSRVHLIQGTSDGKQEWEIALDSDLDRLRKFLTDRPQIRLIVLDPVTSYIGEVDPNKPKEVRPFLNKLKKFAETMNVSLLLIMHLSKNPDVSALHRVGGAATWIEVPRSVWFFDLKQQEDESAPPAYVMMNGKLNIVADDRKKSLGYKFSGVDVLIKGVSQSVGTISWGEECSLTLDQQFGKSSREKPGPSPEKRDAAKDWLREQLSTGPVAQRDIDAAAKIAGHKIETLRDAKKELGVASQRRDGSWYWSLTDQVSQDA